SFLFLNSFRWRTANALFLPATQRVGISFFHTLTHTHTLKHF
ncbi:hypothetical protein N509_03216, partial [Brucella abortus BC95]